MTKVLVEETNLSNIANAIREKTNTTDTFKPSEMSEAIYSITSSNEDLSTELTTQDILLNTQETSIEDIIEALEGKTVATPVLQAKSVIPTTSNQEVTPDSGYDGLSAVTVSAVTSAIDSDIIAGNIKKGVNILGVTGTLEEGITPTGTKEITENGTYDITNYASANVNVPTGGGELPEIGVVITKYTKTGWPFGLSLVGMTEIPAYMFYQAIYKTTSEKRFLYQCPNPVLPDGLQKIGDYAFAKCNQLSLTSLPDSVTDIGLNAFDGCSILRLKSLPSGLTSLGVGAFYSCNNIELTELPSGLTVINNNTFRGCDLLKLTELPSGVTSIGNYAFNGCGAMNLTSLPSGLTSIGTYAFEDSGLSVTRLPETLTSIGTRCFSGMRHCDIKYIPSGVLDIPNSCFSSNTHVTELTIEGDINTIGPQVFYLCTNFNKLVLPNVTKVPTLSNANAFASSGIYNKTGYIYVPDTLVDSFKSASNWSNYANQIKGLSELPTE